MDEIARGGASTVRRALGFDRDADADGTSSDAVAVLEPAGAAHNPSLLAQIFSKLGESNSGVTCDSNGLSKTATPAFQQEVVSRIVTEAESHQSTNGWRARNDGDAKRVLALECLPRQRSA